MSSPQQTVKSLKVRLAEAEAEVARLKKISRSKREPIKGWIGGVIQREREARGLSVTDLANSSGVAKGQISRIESKPDANPNLETLFRIAEGLDIPLSEMLALAESEGPIIVIE